MTEGLGYPRFGAQGGDWGAIVTARLGYAHPDKLIGIYMTAVGGAQPYLGPGAREVSQREQEFIEEREAWRRDEGAYFHIQATKPQTLGYGLNDSPTGLAAWIVDRFRTWGKSETDEEKRRYYTRGRDSHQHYHLLGEPRPSTPPTASTTRWTIDPGV